MTLDDIIQYSQKQGFDSAKILTTFKDEVVYKGTYDIDGFCGGFPLLMTIRNNKIYEYTRNEILEILASL